VWDGIKDSKDASDYQAYLQQYPNGLFAGIAKSRLAQYGVGVSRTETAPASAPAAQPTAPAAAPMTDTTNAAPDDSSDPAPASINTSNSGAAKKCAVHDDTLSDADLCRRNRKEKNKSGGGKH
jgi:hypothetical protein